MIKIKYRHMKICGDRINFADVENTITYSLCPDKLEKNLNKREDELCNKISDLEAKLAEREKKAYSRGHSQRDIDNEIKLNALREDVSNKEKRIVELKQQLAEKEEEINVYKKYIKVEDQEKISFAIEQIKNLKLLILSNWRENDCNLFLGDIGEIIDNQIKQLKETK